MGTGSAVYEHILCAIWCLGRSFKRLFGSDWATGGVWLSRFSAVYGALGAVLASGVDEPDGVLVLDVLPTGRRLAVGGVLEQIKLERRALLEWGSLGMQQLSPAHRERLLVMGYTGNSSPDHMDHLHGLFYFLII